MKCRRQKKISKSFDFAINILPFSNASLYRQAARKGAFCPDIEIGMPFFGIAGAEGAEGARKLDALRLRLS